MDDDASVVDRIAKAPGGKPKFKPKLQIPEKRSVADRIASFASNKTQMVGRKGLQIPDVDRNLPQPKYQEDNPANDNLDKGNGKGNDVGNGKGNGKGASKGNDVSKNYDFADQLVKCINFGHIGNTLYVRRDNIYEPLLVRDFDLLLRREALKNKLLDDLKKSISSYKSSELYAWLLVHPSVPELPEEPDKRYLAVQNGILDLKERELLQVKDFSNSDFPVLFNRINAKYVEYDDSEWRNSETYCFLKRLANPDCEQQCIYALIYVIGKICSNDRSGKNLYYIYGASNNGKSVLALYIQEILGSGNFGNLSLKDLTLQFAMINLRHALVNISTDEDTAVWRSSTASIIKRITGHDTLMVDVKYERMQQFRPYCVLLCIGNEEPKYSRELDAGGAISKRLFLIPTGPTVENPDDDLLKRLKGEKNLLFSVAINFFMKHKHPDKIVDVEDIISPAIHPKDVFNRWVSDCVDKTDNDDELLTEDLWKNYCGYVQSVPSSSRMKQRTFEMECAVKLGNNKSQSRSRNRACYVGLRLVKKIYSPDNKSDEPIESTKSTKSTGEFGGW